MIDGIILGISQGISEWLPVSSEGVTALLSINSMSLTDIIELSLFLHLGTFFSALVYFRKDVIKLIKAILKYKTAEENVQKLFKFLFISTLFSGAIGLLIVRTIANFDKYKTTSKAITLGIGLLLLLTALLLIKTKVTGSKKRKDLKMFDALLLGIVQGFSVLPGLSRSGLTVSALLIRSFDKVESLKISFLMSLPIVLGGNILLGLSNFSITEKHIWGLTFSFIFGLTTIHVLIKLAERIKFGYFVLAFGLLTIILALLVLPT